MRARGAGGDRAGREVERGEEDASGDGDGGALRAVETFRELTLDTLDEFLRHAVGTDDDVALPDVPKGSAERLREHAIDTLDGWVSKFGTRYKQLALARAFVTTRLGDEAPEARAERARRAEIEREHAAQRQLQQSWQTMARELRRC